MKIAVYKDTFANNRGADIAVKNLATGLSERGHAVTLFDKSKFAEKVRGDYDVIISAGTNERIFAHGRLDYAAMRVFFCDNARYVLGNF